MIPTSLARVEWRFSAASRPESRTESRASARLNSCRRLTADSESKKNFYMVLKARSTRPKASGYERSYQ